MQFLKVLPSARATGLGEAYTVWATGAEAIFWNPAGLAKLDNMEFSTTYIDWLFDAKQGALSYALAIPNFGTIGLQVQYVDFGDPFLNREGKVNESLFIDGLHPNAKGYRLLAKEIDKIMTKNN